MWLRDAVLNKSLLCSGAALFLKIKSLEAHILGAEVGSVTDGPPGEAAPRQVDRLHSGRELHTGLERPQQERWVSLAPDNTATSPAGAFDVSEFSP